MSDLVDRFLIRKETLGNRAVSTVDKYRKMLLKLEMWLGNTRIEQASRQQLEEFVGMYAHKELKLSPSARKPLVSAVRGFYQWLELEKIIDCSPAQLIPYPKVGRKLPVAMQLANAERLLMQPDLSTFAGVRDATILSLMIGSGPRIAGVVALNERDLIWQDKDGELSLTVRLTEKGHKQRLVPAHPDTMWMLRAYLGHETLETIDRTLPDSDRVLFVSMQNQMLPAHEYFGEARRISSRAIDQMIKKYGMMAGIPEEELHAHALRHLFGAELAEDDVDLLIRQSLLGHADAKTTEIYSHLATRKLAKATGSSSPLAKMYSPARELSERLRGKAK